MHMSFIFSKILCCWNQLSVLWLPGNREGKIFVWELQSSPPVLIARLVCFSLHVKYNPQSVYWWPYILLYISGCLMLSQNLPLDRLPCPMMEGNLNIRFSLRKSWVLLVHCSFPIHFLWCVFQPIKKMAIYTWYKVNGREKCSGNTQTQLCPLLMCYDVIINAKQTHLPQITYFFFAAAPFSAVVRMEQYGAGMLYRLKKSIQMGLSDSHFVVLFLG